MGAEIDQSRPAAAGRAPRVRPVNGFRVFALFGVVIIHLIGVSGFFAAHPGSNASVAIWSVFGNSLDIFFIISGFVLFLPVIRRGGELGDKWAFWVGRGARLLPAFWLVLAIMVLLVAIKPPGPDYRFPTVLELAAHVPVMQLPVQLLDSGFRIGFGINGPLWMLSIVVSFYALLPFIARAWYRHPLIGLAIGHHPPLVRDPRPRLDRGAAVAAARSGGAGRSGGSPGGGAGALLSAPARDSCLPGGRSIRLAMDTKRNPRSHAMTCTGAAAGMVAAE